MKIRTIIAVFFLLVATMAVKAKADDAAASYKAKCAMCHGVDGKGSAMGQKMGTHDLTTGDAAKESDADWASITKKGKGKMPAYDGKLSDDQINDLVKFMRTLK